MEAEINPPSTVLSPPFIEFKDRVAQDQQQHEIEGRELAGLAFSRDPQDQDQEDVNDQAAQHELPPGQAQIPHGSSVTGRP